MEHFLQKAGDISGQLQKSVDALGGGLTKYIAQAVYEERKIRHSSHLWSEPFDFWVDGLGRSISGAINKVVEHILLSGLYGISGGNKLSDEAFPDFLVPLVQFYLGLLPRLRSL